MASIYDKIKTAWGLCSEAAVRGFSTKEEDVVRAQDIIANTSTENLVEVAEKFHDTFYMILFNCWERKDAIAFYNMHSNPAFAAGVTAIQQVKELNEQAQHLNQQLKQEHQARQAEIREKLEAIEKVNVLEGRVHARDMEIMELKAKLYDLMTSERKEG